MAKIRVNMDGMFDLKNKFRYISKEIHSLENDIQRSFEKFDLEVSNKDIIREQIKLARLKASKLAERSNQLGVTVDRVINAFNETDIKIIHKQKETTNFMEKVMMGFLGVNSRILNGVSRIGLQIIAALQKAERLFLNKPNQVKRIDLQQVKTSLSLTNILISPISNIITGDLLKNRINHIQHPKKKQKKLVSPSLDLRKNIRRPLNVGKVIQGIKGDSTIIKGQGYLSAMGFLVGTSGPNKNGVDGRWGNMGKASTKMFQQMIGLKPTGKLDKVTLAKMKEYAVKGFTFKEIIKHSYKKSFRPMLTKGLSQAERMNVVYFYATLDEEKSGVPAAITAAQCLQESNAGLRIPTDKNKGKLSYNMFGIKATKSWLKNGGDYVISNTWEHRKGKNYIEEHKFRAYDNYLESVRDHSKFLKQNKRYSGLFKIKKDENYLSNWCKGLQKAGYATDDKYSKNLIHIIDVYGLK